jgi:cytochrome b subunit of formate dehydrogenase
MTAPGRFAAPLILSVSVALLLAAPLWAAGDDCLICHGEPSSDFPSVDSKALQSSIHAGLDCTDCHAELDAEEIPHPADRIGVDCAMCHGDVPDTHLFHAPDPDSGELGYGLACIDCHGSHGVVSPRAGGDDAGAAPLNALCASCHDEVVEHFERSEHGRSLANRVKGAPDCLTCHDRPITEARERRNGADLKIHQERVCLSCHLDDPEVRARIVPAAGFIAAYEESVHGAALLEGDAAAANCVSCHGSHDMKHGNDPDAQISREHLPETCGNCHAEIARQYSESTHGEMLRKGNHDAPVCTTCHGEHDIIDPSDPRSPVAPANVSAQVCSPCHNSVRMSEKYGIASDRFKTFSDSFHGMAIRGGQVEVANCASCHGAHAILPADDPRSTIHLSNLEATCGQCHPGANQRFARGEVHVAARDPNERILYWVSTLYISLIVVVIGGMLVHNGFDFARRTGHKLRERRDGPQEGGAHHGGAHYVRMSLEERLQHGALMSSFIVLVITGFMLHYPEAWWVVALRRISDDLFQLRSLLHRVAGIVMVVASGYHLYYLGFTSRGREFLRDMLPRHADIPDTLQSIAYNLRMTSQRPRFDRFSYIEKAEYWALVWGTIVMAATGFILWFENTFIGLLTKLGWDVSRLVHFYEAWLAMLAIIVWHLYFVMFNPDIYPMNTAWLTGRITEAEMEEEHPLELERLRRSKPAQAAERLQTPQPARREGGAHGQ